MSLGFNPFTGTFDNKGCSPLIKSPCYTVPANSTLTVDTLTLSQFKCLDYFLCIDKGSSFDPRTLSMKVWHNDTRVCDLVYARNRGDVSVEVIATNTGSNYELQVVNNESTDINVKYTRQKL